MARVEWYGGQIVWLGRVDGAHFIVDDIIDRGISEKVLTGRQPIGLRPIPIEVIQRRGGTLLPCADESQGMASSPGY